MNVLEEPQSFSEEPILNLDMLLEDSDDVQSQLHTVIGDIISAKSQRTQRTQ